MKGTKERQGVADKPIPEQDPIVTKSYVGAYLLAAVLMMLSLLWALWDENYTQRPWKKYQEEFRQRYSSFLGSQVSSSGKDLSSVTNSPEYKEIDAAEKAAIAEAKPKEDQLKKQIDEVTDHINAVQAVYTDAKAQIGADTYSVETGTIDEVSARVDKKEHDRRVAELEKKKNKPEYKVDYPADKDKRYSYNQLEELYLDLKNEKARLVAALGEVQKPYKELDAKKL